MKLISLDIEATDSGEMLELSVFRYKDKTEIYHSYYKPINTDNWSNKAHHITPEMVKNAPTFKSERRRVQEIINEADGIIGFALHNDIKYLKNHNINIPAQIILLEVQDWFWLYIGKEIGIDFGSVPRLSKCAEILEFNFSEDTDAHSATNDTMITIKIFEKILDKCNSGEIDQVVIKNFVKSFEEERNSHAEKIAKGVLSLVRETKGYILKNNSLTTERVNGLSIVVNSRYLAEHDIRDKFKKRETSPNSGVYNLKNSDIDFFINYTNVYNASTEEIYRHIYNAKKSRKNRLNFNLR